MSEEFQCLDADCWCHGAWAPEREMMTGYDPTGMWMVERNARTALVALALKLPELLLRCAGELDVAAEEAESALAGQLMRRDAAAIRGAVEEAEVVEREQRARHNPGDKCPHEIPYSLTCPECSKATAARKAAEEET